MTVRTEDFHMEKMAPDGDKPPYIQIIGDPADRASVFKKLAAVNKAVKKLKHTGNYSAGSTKYTYATEADVVEPIAAALEKAGLATMPSIVEMWWHDLPGKYGTNRICTVHAQLMVGCTDTGAYIVAHTFSSAANADKATNSAFTTALKYLLAKMALVAFGDDADEYTVEGDHAAGKAAARKPPAKTSPQVRPVAKSVLEELMAEVVDAGAEDAVKAFLKDNKFTWSKMNEAQVEGVRTVIKMQKD